MYVILDTNVIHHDFYLSNTVTRQLFEQAHLRGFVVCIPEIVLMEMVAHFREETQKTAEALSKNLRYLDRLLARQASSVPTTDVEDEVRRYRARLDATLAQMGALVLPVPKIGMGLLAEKAISRRKPFQADGQGLCDALIWASVVELCREHPLRQVAMITNDKDYADSDDVGTQESRLHPDLLHDLGVFSIEAVSVTGQQSVPENAERSGLAELHTSIGRFDESWRRRYGTPVNKSDQNTETREAS